MTNNCRTAIMALNIIVGHKVSTSVGRSFYIPQGAHPITGSPYCQRNFWLFAFFAFLTIGAIWSVNGLYSTQLEVDQSFFFYFLKKNKEKFLGQWHMMKKR
ncbi:unnamed protein product [Rhizophagus irregularis]|nr:unnamed protein product [Rhizophagus irregularis]